MNTFKMVITGAPGTGKSTLIKALAKKGVPCMEEISRDILLKARAQGIQHLFKTNPLLFSELLLKERKNQFHLANNYAAKHVFFDRGIPDILAYLNFAKIDYPDKFQKTCEDLVYHLVFILKPWKAIYKTDNERCETFDEAKQIHDCLTKTYLDFNYKLIELPFDTVDNRTKFVLNTIGI